MDQSVAHTPSRGFTLIELMVTLAVAAVLATLAAPFLRDFVTKNRAAGISNELTGAILRARNEAVTRNACVSLCASDDASDETPTCSAGDNWQDGWIVFVNPGCDSSVTGPEDAEDLLLARPAGASDFTLTDASSDNSQVIFNPMGRLHGVGARRFHLSNNSGNEAYDRSICLGAMGRTRLIAGSDSSC